MTVDECIVSGFMRSRVKPVAHADDRTNKQNDGCYNENCGTFV
jgi:hypothetical protein